MVVYYEFIVTELFFCVSVSATEPSEVDAGVVY
jgi:hypothetical protein